MADLGEGLDKVEEEVENLKNTKITLFGISMTPTTIGAAFALIGSLLGGLYGAFEVYKDYMEMKAKLADLDVEAIAARNDLIETKLDEAIDYTRDIKSGLRDDILAIEKQADLLSGVRALGLYTDTNEFFEDFAERHSDSLLDHLELDDEGFVDLNHLVLATFQRGCRGGAERF